MTQHAMSEKKVIRVEGGRFAPGNNANPGGRPKGLERRVRELVDFDKVISGLYDIAMGKLPPGISNSSTVSIKERILASQELLNRGFGKSKITVDLAADITQNGLGAINVDALDADALDALESAISNVIGAPVPTRVLAAPVAPHPAARFLDEQAAELVDEGAPDED